MMPCASTVVPPAVPRQGVNVFGDVESDETRKRSVLVERRLPGETFPRVPVGGVELTREQVAVALFTQVDRVPPGYVPDWQLLNLVEEALAAHGVEGLDARLAELEALPMGDRRVTWASAWRLCTVHWYRDAVAELMDAYQVACALYASDLPMGRSQSSDDRPVELQGHLSEGIARLGARALIPLGWECEREFPRGPRAQRAPESALDASYLAAMPDRRRRRFCLMTAINRVDALKNRPLVAWFDDNVDHPTGWAIGCVPPPCPYSVARRAWVRAGNAAGKRSPQGVRA